MPRRNDTMGGRKLCSVGAASLNEWLRGGGACNTVAPGYLLSYGLKMILGLTDDSSGRKSRGAVYFAC